MRAQWALIAEKGITRGNPEGGIRVLIKTPKGRPTASNVFVGANQLAKSVGQTTVITAPQTRLLVPMTPPNLRAVFVPDGPNSCLTVQWDDVPRPRLMILSGCGLSPSKSSAIGRWRFTHPPLISR